MHLIDAQSKQLQDSVQFIEKLRSGASSSKQPGAIKTYTPDKLREALQDAWLVVEVRFTSGLSSRFSAHTSSHD